MAVIFTRLSSIHGRRIAMSATGAIVDGQGYGAVMADASGVLQTRIRSYADLVSSSAAAIVAYGLTCISSVTSSALNFTLAAPTSGMGKEIFSLSSASTITIETTSSDIKFQSTAGGSSKLTISAGGGCFGQRVVLRAFTTSRWLALSQTAGVS